MFINPKNISQYTLSVWISQTFNIPKKSLDPHLFLLEFSALGTFPVASEAYLGGLLGFQVIWTRSSWISNSK